MQCALWWLIVPSVACAALAPAQAQESLVTVQVDLRVVSSRIGSAVIDRGTLDGLERGDRITFTTRECQALWPISQVHSDRSSKAGYNGPTLCPGIIFQNQCL
jgi:hypothetical protein